MKLSSYHIPVLAEAIAELGAGAHRVVDCTVGGGGHAARFAAAGAALLAIDQDPEAIEAARATVQGDQCTWLTARFSDPVALEAIARFRPEFVLLDLGVSTAQLERGQRGFSFRPGAPLDMRMDPSTPATAADLLNALEPTELTRVFREFGDEPKAGRLATVIAARRATRPFATSDDLVNAVRATLGPRSGPADFARIFQALRIAVNDELVALERVLPAALAALEPAGRLAVISYHSGEDRIVKHCFREWSRSCVCPPRAPICTCRGRALGTVETRRPVRPGPDEIAANPRARSAKLRVFRKADAD